MKVKHSKYKNTGILFELLTRQITSDTVSGRDTRALSILKKHSKKLPTIWSQDLHILNIFQNQVIIIKQLLKD